MSNYLIIAALLGVLVVLVAVLIKMNREQKAEEKLQRAAEVLFRYRGLESALANDYSWDAERSRIFLCISWKDHGRKLYVFDPGNGVNIGYDPRKNHVSVLDKTVSAEHCTLFLHGIRVYVKDKQSTNGTFIRRGFRKMRVVGSTEIMDNDRLIIGRTELKIMIRTYRPSC